MSPEQPLRVLVIDDQPEFGESLGEVLQTSGCEVDVALTPYAGITYSEGRRYDLVLVDLQMPQMSGLETLRLLQPRGHGCLLLMTGYPDAVTLPEVEAVGAQGVLAKPMSLDRLLEIVRYVQEHRHDGSVRLPSTLCENLRRECVRSSVGWAFS